MENNLAYFTNDCREFSKDNLVIYNISDETLQIVGNLSKRLTEKREENVKFTIEEFSNLIYDEVDGDEVFKIWNKILSKRRSSGVRFEFKIRDIYKNVLDVRINLKSLYSNEGKLEYCFGLIHDITRERRTEEELKNIVDFDGVTNLPSKYYTRGAINNYLVDCQKDELRGALILVNIDNFKFINDSYGHEDGDMLLKKIAIRLRRTIGTGDLLCRYSGDEYIIFRHSIYSIEEARKFVIGIKKSFDAPFILKGREIYITASIGIALFPDNGMDFNELLKNSDTAMYRAKSNGKDEIEFFDSSISNELNRIYDIEKGLRTAIQDNEFYVVFQPKVVLEDSRVNGFEALLRWNSKTLGLVGPVEFIPIAESTRMIIPIGKFVLEEVFKEVKNLLEEGYDDFKIAVNFSEVQFRNGDIVSDFNEFIKKYNVPPKYIEVEITESMLMKTCEDNIMKLNEIKKLGLSVALDDFGTGYSSLNYLTKMPIDVLKIDRSFVIDILTNPKSKCIVEMIIQLSHDLGINVVAEGVEEVEQVEYLKGIFCDVVQGYYFSKPELFTKVKTLLGKQL